MDIIENVLGHASDPEWKERLEGADVDELELSQWDAQKSRLRGRTAQGRELAVALERGGTLHDGDVLMWDAAGRRAVVCRIRLCPVMAVDMGGLAGLPAEEALAAAVRLGHALGNQHWPAVVKDSAVYVPVAVDKDVAAAVMDTHAVPGTTYMFITGEEASRMLGTAEARRLFGGAEMPLEAGLGHHAHGHRHGHPSGHSHRHGRHHGGRGHHACESAPEGSTPYGGGCAGARGGQEAGTCGSAEPGGQGEGAHGMARYGGGPSCPGHADREEAEACPHCRRYEQA